MNGPRSLAPGAYAGLLLISTASLLFELTLTRVYAVAQGHHFAFVAIATALLGIGASGTLMARSRLLQRSPPARVIGGSGLGFGAAVIAAYLTADRIPFDAYRLAVDPLQLVWLGIYFLIAAVPFVFAGLAVVAALAANPGRAGLPYFATLVGSAAGAALSLLFLPLLGSAGAVLVSAALGALAFGAAARAPLVRLAGLASAGGLVLGAWLVAPAGPSVSPYAGLHQILQHRDARLLETRLTASSRVDLVEGAALRSVPGLSLTYTGEVPRPRLVVTVDSANPAALDVGPGAYLSHTPLALAVSVRPAQRAIVLDPIGGFEAATLRAAGLRRVEVLQPDSALADTWRAAPGPLSGSGMVVHREGLRRGLTGMPPVDLIAWPLRETFQGVAAGTFSIRETFAYTEEAVRAAWRALAPRGLLVISRWRQATPSESLRAWATLAAAAARAGAALGASHMLAWRSLQTVTMVASPTPFNAAEIDALDAALRREGFDWVFYDGLDPANANRFNVLPDNRLHESFAAVAHDLPLPGVAYDVSPVGDDRPYFFHFFQWTGTLEVLRTLGRDWQPFGGAGFLILVPIAAIFTALALAVMLGPLAGGWSAGAGPRGAGQLAFFGLVGAGFAFMQIGILQRLILLLDAPTTAFALGLAALLAFTGIGSALLGGAGARTVRYALAVAILAALTLVALRALAAPILAAPLWAAALSSMALIAPLGMASGAVLPSALAALGPDARPPMVARAWAVNGVASVTGVLTAAITIVTFGFTVTVSAGVALYAAAALLWLRSRPRARAVP